MKKHIKSILAAAIETIEKHVQETVGIEPK